MRDLGAAAMGAVDIIVIDGVLGEMPGKARAVAGFRRPREVIQQGLRIRRRSCRPPMR